MKRLDILILAAGLGTRMKSRTIKVLHAACGKSILRYVLDLAGELSDTIPIVVVGHQREEVIASGGERLVYRTQEKQLGTGHAVLQAEEALRERGLDQSDVLILSGDVPLTRAETLRSLVETHATSRNTVTFLSMKLEEPAMYGRVLRHDSGNVQRIVEAKDATPEELAIDEVNGGIYLVEARFLYDTLHSIGTDNAQGEYYLTDVVEKASAAGKGVSAIVVDDPIELLGVNSRAELASVERELRRRTIERLMSEGVTFRNPESIVIDTDVAIGPDTTVYNAVCIEGSTRIGRDCVVESGVVLRNCTIGDGVRIKVGTVAEDATIEHGASVGPYAHLRPESILGPGVKVGNFVETKKARFGRGAKASHLSYIGDAEVGEDVNIGAGTITCNYDGVRKHRTILEDGVFIGSDTQLVAPVRVGAGAYVGAGSTITRDVPPDALALSRTPQKIREGWAKKKREEREKSEKK